MTAKKKSADLTKVKKGKAKLSHNRVADVMIEKGIIAQELADLIGSNPGHVSRIMQNERPCISLPVALKISKALSTPVEQLFFLETDKNRATREALARVSQHSM